MVKFYMNKIKSVAIMALALFANVAVAQNLKVTAYGNPVSDGDVIEVKCEFEDYSEDFGYFYVYCMWDPKLEVATEAGDQTLFVTVSRVEDLPTFEICWPSQCIEMGPDGIASTSGTIGTDPSHIDIHIAANIEDENDSALKGGGMSKVNLKCGSESMGLTLKALPVDINSVGEIAGVNAPAEYYTIQGVRVAEPLKGQLYIERKGGKVTKRIF